MQYNPEHEGISEAKAPLVRVQLWFGSTHAQVRVQEEVQGQVVRGPEACLFMYAVTLTLSLNPKSLPQSPIPKLPTCAYP